MLMALYLTMAASVHAQHEGQIGSYGYHFGNFKKFIEQVSINIEASQEVSTEQEILVHFDGGVVELIDLCLDRARRERATAGTAQAHFVSMTHAERAIRIEMRSKPTRNALSGEIMEHHPNRHFACEFSFDREGFTIDQDWTFEYLGVQ